MRGVVRWRRTACPLSTTARSPGYSGSGDTDVVCSGRRTRRPTCQILRVPPCDFQVVNINPFHSSLLIKSLIRLSHCALALSILF